MTRRDAVVGPQVEPAEELPGVPGLGGPETGAAEAVPLVEAEEERDDPVADLRARRRLAAAPRPVSRPGVEARAGYGASRTAVTASVV